MQTCFASSDINTTTAAVRKYFAPSLANKIPKILIAHQRSTTNLPGDVDCYL
jgi:hypothetical protein